MHFFSTPSRVGVEVWVWLSRVRDDYQQTDFCNQSIIFPPSGLTQHTQHENTTDTRNVVKFIFKPIVKRRKKSTVKCRICCIGILVKPEQIILSTKSSRTEDEKQIYFKKTKNTSFLLFNLMRFK